MKIFADKAELHAGLTDRGSMTLGARGLTCSRNDRILFRGLEFEVSPGQLLQIEGANGSGKTTLLKALCGFIYPDEGDVLWRGMDIRTVLDEYHGEMNYIGHNNGVKSGLTCLENLRVATALAAAPAAAEPLAVLERHGLGGYEDTFAQLLSSGQRRRLALARLAICPARVWILDEPFTSLDDRGRRFMSGEFRGHLDTGGMIIMTSHDEISWQGIIPVKVGLT